MSAEIRRDGLHRVGQLGFWVGGLFALVSVAAAFTTTNYFFQSYLFAFMVVFALSFGALPLVILHHLTGGRWTATLRPALETAARTLPLCALFAVPILLDPSQLFPWADPLTVAQHATLAKQTWYLNTPAFMARVVIYFLLWIFLTYRLTRAPARRPRLAAAGAIVYMITGLLMAVDLLMSIIPDFGSTIFGMLINTAQILGALAFAVIITVNYRPQADTQTLHDIGNILLLLVLFWIYLAFSQYVIVWYGNLPTEIVWYIVRNHNQTPWLPIGIVLLQFVLPFSVLLSKRAKQRRRWLVRICASILLANLGYWYWLTIPALRFGSSTWHWTDPVLLLALLGLWLGYFARLARDRLPESMEQG